MFWSVGWPLLWAAGFFCNLDILYGGVGIGKLQFLIKKNLNFFSAVIFFQFLVIKALDPDWIRIRIGLQPQPLDPDPEKMNMDPKPWIRERMDRWVIGGNVGSASSCRWQYTEVYSQHDGKKMHSILLRGVKNISLTSFIIVSYL